jgi:mannose-6-phosphate isomerase-like protein (cupin superfamily)
MSRPWSSALVLCGAVIACTPATAAPRVVSPGGSAAPVVWSDAEQQRDVAVRTLRTTDAASFHRVRLRRAEKPHEHERSDLTVFVLSGAVRMHFADRVVPVGAGDVVEIPRGAPHWAENVAEGPSEAYVVFTPAFDGKDSRPVPIESTAR